jgi:hypothetical protein
MPSITPDNALVQVADYLTDSMSGLVPKTNITADAVDQLMAIFKLQAKANKDTATAQRVLRDCAQAERVIKEKQDLENATQMPTLAKHTIPHISSQIYKRRQRVASNHTGQVQGTRIDQHTSTEKNGNAHTGFHAPMHENPWFQSPVHTKTGSFETVPSTDPMQLCLFSLR